MYPYSDPYSDPYITRSILRCESITLSLLASAIDVDFVPLEDGR